MCGRILLIAFFLVVGGCHEADERPKPGPAAPKAGTLAPKFDVYEAVFRHEMKRFPEDKAKRKPIFYMIIDGEDPPTPFLERFAKAAGPVRPGSKAPAKAPEEFAVMLSVGRIEMSGENQARVLGNAYALADAQKCGTPYPTLLARQEGKWVVVVK